MFGQTNIGARLMAYPNNPYLFSVKWIIIGLYNSFLFTQYQAVTRTNDDLLLSGSLRTK